MSAIIRTKEEAVRASTSLNAAEKSMLLAILKGDFGRFLTPNLNTTRRKKPVNGFMAFRAYYSVIFSGNRVPQKDRSPLLRKLWSGDILTAEWCLVASTYTKIRDGAGNKNVPLADFTDCAALTMGFPYAEDYLNIYKWQWVQVDETHDLIQPVIPELRRYPAFTSEFDILVNCMLLGYKAPGLMRTLSAMARDRRPRLVVRPMTFDSSAIVRRGNFGLEMSTDPISLARALLPHHLADEFNIEQGVDVIRVDNLQDIAREDMYPRAEIGLVMYNYSPATGPSIDSPDLNIDLSQHMDFDEEDHIRQDVDLSNPQDLQAGLANDFVAPSSVDTTLNMLAGNDPAFDLNF